MPLSYFCDCIASAVVIIVVDVVDGVVDDVVVVIVGVVVVIVSVFGWSVFCSFHFAVCLEAQNRNSFSTLSLSREIILK